MNKTDKTLITTINCQHKIHDLNGPNCEYSNFSSTLFSTACSPVRETWIQECERTPVPQLSQSPLLTPG